MIKMEKIRIAYIAKEMPINGISTVILNYCRNLDKNKFDITIFSGEPIDKYYIEECKKIDVNIEKMPPKRGGNPLKYYDYLFKKITGKNYVGYVMIIPDASKVKLVDSRKKNRGTQLSEIVENNNAIAGINAGGFTDDGGVGRGHQLCKATIIDKKLFKFF